jgi:hypothetical protein
MSPAQRSSCDFTASLSRTCPWLTWMNMPRSSR